MRTRDTSIPGVLVLEPRVFGDPRGFFVETWQRERYAGLGLPREFVQDNLASSERGVLRGLHVQHPHPQGKLVQVISGEVFDVAVDIRRGSPWFGKWVGVRLSGGNRHQLWVPAGFAHGYCVLSEQAVFAYKCTDFYHPEAELTLLWNDPALGIDWPLAGEPVLSDKDRAGLPLGAVDPDRLPPYGP
jgi:dTDP-4-dehydrorhamnose 3,5-epimerase